jgi:hypothetical protein
VSLSDRDEETLVGWSAPRRDMSVQDKADMLADAWVNVHKWHRRTDHHPRFMVEDFNGFLQWVKANRPDDWLTRRAGVPPVRPSGPAYTHI